MSVSILQHVGCRSRAANHEQTWANEHIWIFRVSSWRCRVPAHKDVCVLQRLWILRPFATQLFAWQRKLRNVSFISIRKLSHSNFPGILVFTIWQGMHLRRRGVSLAWWSDCDCDWFYKIRNCAFGEEDHHSNVYGCVMASGSASAGIWILKVRCHRLHVTSEFATAKFRSYTGKFDWISQYGI